MPVIFRSYIIVSSFVLITLIVVGIKSNFAHLQESSQLNEKNYYIYPFDQKIQLSVNNSNLRFINPLKSYRRSEHHQEKDYYVIPYSEANKGPQYFSINMANYTIVPVDDHLQDGFSIVIVTFNEKYLLKTIYSILDNTDLYYLKEIVVIDDCSSPPVQLPDSLPSFIKKERNGLVKNLGLIKARVLGGNLATSKYLVFLDAHVAVCENWLHTPLLYLKEDEKTIVNFINFILDEEKFAAKSIRSGFGSSAGIYWNLRQFWGGGSTQDIYSPITMGMFAITKYWWSQGEMDSGLNKWGGENVDISFRTWLCGGRIVVAKDSYVAHLFRRSFPYKVDSMDVQRNYIRVAKVWMEEPYLSRFYSEARIKLNKNQEPVIHYGNITERLKLKEKLQCKPFHYYYNKFKNRSPCTKNEQSKGCGKIHTLGYKEIVVQETKKFFSQ